MNIAIIGKAKTFQTYDNKTFSNQKEIETYLSNICPHIHFMDYRSPKVNYILQDKRYLPSLKQKQYFNKKKIISFSSLENYACCHQNCQCTE
jgi:hypothetical protein